jgi:hypothetical protein
MRLRGERDDWDAVGCEDDDWDVKRYGVGGDGGESNIIQGYYKQTRGYGEGEGLHGLQKVNSWRGKSGMWTIIQKI